MRRFQMTNLFALFFDPKVPILFLLGSLALALMGNAMYDLLITMYGATPRTYWSVGIGAMLIFGFVIFGFRLLVGILERRRQGRVITVPSEQHVAPHTGLLLLVGPNPNAPDKAIADYHLRDLQLKHCWLVASPEARLRMSDLAQWLNDRNVYAHPLPVDNAHQSHLTYQAVTEGVRAARTIIGAQALIVDITGGTKPMTVGAVLACLDTETPLEYYLHPVLPDGSPDLKGQPKPMRVDLHYLYKDDNQ